MSVVKRHVFLTLPQKNIWGFIQVKPRMNSQEAKKSSTVRINLWSHHKSQQVTRVSLPHTFSHSHVSQASFVSTHFWAVSKWSLGTSVLYIRNGTEKEVPKFSDLDLDGLFHCFSPMLQSLFVPRSVCTAKLNFVLPAERFWPPWLQFHRLGIHVTIRWESYDFPDHLFVKDISVLVFFFRFPTSAQGISMQVNGATWCPKYDIAKGAQLCWRFVLIWTWKTHAHTQHLSSKKSFCQESRNCTKLIFDWQQRTILVILITTGWCGLVTASSKFWTNAAKVISGWCRSGNEFIQFVSCQMHILISNINIHGPVLWPWTMR